ncbi:MAG: cupin, partial [Gammaproteobacteria bacterium]|nr:cupin [Gammaproteobacteria bacterium]
MDLQVILWKKDTPPTQDEIEQILEGEGLLYYSWSNGPGDIYPAHVHPFDKILYVV